MLIASIWAVSAYGQVSDLEKLKQEGRDLFDMEKYHEALTKFNEVLKISPNEQEALYEKAATFLNSASNTIQAKVYYNLADQLFSLSAENREKRKDWEDEALRYSHLAISCSPNCG